jgi:proteic killer suppression protein
MARKLRLRLDALEAAESLADFWPPYSGPERCHELEGNRVGVYSMDVRQPYRLLFRATDESGYPPDPTSKDKADGKQLWLAIRAITLISVEDTHD